ncbi:F0F1 ATP synthase subunit A [Euzebya tangerina]|uniref:F0F1 ATP synthase subunit A n=1 Tax=Euzebya tangerina TaxID=591198 RepID=UPI000E30B579|nr:F0F1 ATP synthase subunit A [Euzebya tangerina]
MNLVLAAEPYGADFKVPPAGEIFNLPPLFEIAGVGVTRVYLIIFFSVLFASILMLLAFNNPKVIPGKLQSIGESIVEFVRDGIAVDIIGPEGKKFAPFLTTIFLFVLFNNMFKIIPFVNFPSTSRIAIPLILALITLVVFVGTGIKYQGLSYFKEVAFPPGVPKPVYILLTPIELVSTFILRPLTLTVRLFANMVAGHILLTIVFLATHAFFRLPGIIPEGSNLAGLPVGILTLALGPITVAFEGFVSFLQAYIFAILAAVYLAGAVEPEH